MRIELTPTEVHEIKERLGSEEEEFVLVNMANGFLKCASASQRRLWLHMLGWCSVIFRSAKSGEMDGKKMARVLQRVMFDLDSKMSDEVRWADNSEEWFLQEGNGDAYVMVLLRHLKDVIEGLE